MSAIELEEIAPSGFSSVKTATIKAMTDPAEMIRWLNKHDKLSDSDYEACVHDLGFRAAVWTMRQAALRGDLRTVNACKVYIDRVELSRSRAASAADPTRTVSAEFAPVDRSAPVDEE